MSPASGPCKLALGGYQSLKQLITPGGRLYESRRAITDAVNSSRFLKLEPPRGAMYAFLGVDTHALPGFDDQQFALDLLEQKHVLIAPGVSFNVPYRNHFRVTTLPDATTLKDVFGRMDELLTAYANAPRADSSDTGETRSGENHNVVEAGTRFK